MAPTPMSNDAKEELNVLSKWFQTAKVQPEKENMSRCIDDNRLTKIRPFLETLGLYKKVPKFHCHNWKES